jgi:hypothetical protein
MIELQNIQIEIEGLKILQIDQYYDLTSGCVEYDVSPNSGGLSFKSEAIINDINEGYIYVTQVCTNHILKIGTLNAMYSFDSQGEIFRDTPSTQSCRFKFFQIKDNFIRDFSGNQNEFAFFDAPFRELLPCWTAIDYELKFETWIQYSKTANLNIDLKPLLKFNWELEAKENQVNDLWVISSSSYSNVDNIKNSIQYLSENDNPFLPCELRHLGNTMREFYLQHDELKKNNS